MWRNYYISEEQARLEFQLTVKADPNIHHHHHNPENHFDTLSYQ